MTTVVAIAETTDRAKTLVVAATIAAVASIQIVDPEVITPDRRVA